VFAVGEDPRRRKESAATLVSTGTIGVVLGDGTDPDRQCPQLHRWTGGERDEHRKQAAVFDAVAVTLGGDRGWSVP
jgi:hypothetical protein